MKISKDIKSKRKSKGITQADLASQVGVSAPTMAKIENGQNSTVKLLENIYLIIDPEDETGHEVIEH